MKNIGKENLENAMKELNGMTPAPMDTMLDKQSREDALAKRVQRKAMTVQNIPPTIPGILFFCITRLTFHFANVNVL